jgi:invasion protein IalB
MFPHRRGRACAYSRYFADYTREEGAREPSGGNRVLGHKKKGATVMWRVFVLAAAACGLVLVLGGEALAQAGGNASPGGAVPKPAQPDQSKNAKAAAEPAKPPDVAVAGNFGQWALICGKDKDKDGKEPCSLVQALVQKETQKLVFRLTVAYGPKGNLVLRIDGPTGVALQKGLEFSPDAVKVYRLQYQACLAQGCSALLLMPEVAQGHNHGLRAERPGAAGRRRARRFLRRACGARQAPPQARTVTP